MCCFKHNELRPQLHFSSPSEKTNINFVSDNDLALFSHLYNSMVSLSSLYTGDQKINKSKLNLGLNIEILSNLVKSKTYDHDAYFITLHIRCVLDSIHVDSVNHDMTELLNTGVRDRQEERGSVYLGPTLQRWKILRSSLWTPSRKR